MIAAVPLLILVVAAYHALVFVTGTVLTNPLASFAMPSGAPFSFTVGDILVAAGLFLLYLEIFKATRTGVASIIDHLLSIALFIGCLLELLLLPQMGTATFLLLTLMTLIDVIAGFTVTISGARRDFGVEGSLR